MAIVMAPARTGPGAVPLINYGAYDDTDAIVQGSVLILTAGIYNLAGADPTVIAGIALQAKDTAPGFQAANNPSPITGRQAAISVATADRNTVFQATLTNGGATRIAPAQADVGESYGITAYSGVWTVDKAKTGNDARVNIIGFSTQGPGAGIVFFKFLQDHTEGAA